MNYRHFFQPPGRLGLIALTMWVSAAAYAQNAPPAPTPQKNPTTAQKAVTSYQSALDGYIPYAEDKTGNWKEANALTARVGGWRAYAKEAAQTESDPHAGHDKPAQVQPTQAKP